MQLSPVNGFAMLIEDWPISKVRPYPNNPRVLRNASEKVAESIKSFGWRQPIVVDADGVIIAGHSRHAAAQLLKIKTVPVHVAKDLTPDQVRALRIADNKTATFSDWDDAKLADELAEIMSGLGAITVTGFTRAEFDAIEMQAKAALAQVLPPAPVHVPRAPVQAAEAEPAMVEAGLNRGEICTRLGMEGEELDRLLDRSGMTVRGTAGVNGFGRAWVPGREG